MKKRVVQALGCILAMTMVVGSLTACGGKSEKKAEKKAGSDVKVAIICSAAGQNDNGYNQSAVEGAKKAADEFGIEYKVVEPTTGVPQALESLADDGYNVFFNLEYDFEALIQGTGGAQPIAEMYPDTTFVCVNDNPNQDEDGNTIHDNVISVLFDVHQASFVAGALTTLVNENAETLFGIILCVIGGIFAYKANVLNIALEGMMLNGAFISVLVEYLTGSVALAVIAAIVTTLLWGLVFSFLGITCNGNVIVIGLGINLIVPAIAKFVLKVMELANISLQDVGVADFKINIPGIKSIPLIGGIVSGHPVITYLAFIGIAAAAILMYKTKFGIYVRVVGENEDSAISLGLKTQKYKYIAVLIGAFCCALAGINLSMERMAMFTSDMTAGRGFIAIAAIYCGQGKPVQSSLYAILFGVARSLAVNLSVYAGPAAGMFDTIPYIIMVAVLAVVSFMKFKDVKVRGYKFD